MTTEKMKELLSGKDEKITIEYKSCINEISESVYETVASFSNRYGGWIIMRVQDGGIPVGVNRNAAKDMICENQKISVDDIAARLDVTRRTVLRDIQEIKRKVFLLYNKKESLWKLK